MSVLKDIGIIKGRGKASQFFEKMAENHSFLDMKYEAPHKFVNYCWTKYRSCKEQDPRMDIGIFRYIIYTLLYREKVLPFYTQAKVAFVPNIEFDTILYSRALPVCLSLKTSLRERYKQADLEAIALKYVHRKARCFLLTLDSREAKATKAKIPEGLLIGLDDVVDCNTEQIDLLIQQLKEMQFCVSSKIDVIEGNLVKSDIPPCKNKPISK